jgi:hypothetical protein
MEYIFAIFGKILKAEGIVVDNIYDWNLMSWGEKPTAPKPLQMPGIKVSARPKKALKNLGETTRRRGKYDSFSAGNGRTNELSSNGSNGRKCNLF